MVHLHIYTEPSWDRREPCSAWLRTRAEHCSHSLALQMLSTTQCCGFLKHNSRWMAHLEWTKTLNFLFISGLYIYEQSQHPAPKLSQLSQLITLHPSWQPSWQPSWHLNWVSWAPCTQAESTEHPTPKLSQLSTQAESAEHPSRVNWALCTQADSQAESAEHWASYPQAEWRRVQAGPRVYYRQTHDLPLLAWWCTLGAFPGDAVLGSPRTATAAWSCWDGSEESSLGAVRTISEKGSHCIHKYIYIPVQSGEKT